MPKYLYSFVLFFTFLAADATAQVIAPQQPPETMSLSGPRVGMTYLSPNVVDQIKEEFDHDLNPVISQFGWQFEKRFMSSDTGATAVTEWVVLLGGIDQGVVIPSLTWLVGMRTVGGVEFAAGPNLSPAGAGVAIAAGVTMRVGNLNVPFNAAVVPSANGPRFSFLLGFNAKRR
ncbi:MAG TPA: hypothetical protein VM096_13370 [Vicinamibacterales bacterium]|nr:hypothetical protein [Vicinamibacterales bacterium]